MVVFTIVGVGVVSFLAFYLTVKFVLLVREMGLIPALCAPLWMLAKLIEGIKDRWFYR